LRGFVTFAYYTRQGFVLSSGLRYFPDQPIFLERGRTCPSSGEHAKPGEAVWLIDVNGFWVNGKQVFSDGPSLMPIEGWQDTVLPLK